MLLAPHIGKNNGRNSDRDLNPKRFHTMPVLSVVPESQCTLWDGPGVALRYEVLREHFRRASWHCSVRMTTLPQPRDQQESLGVAILLEVLASPGSDGFDKQFMGQSTGEGAFEAGREL